ncbi:MAG: WbqC family protein, partial [Bacteroidales bacterium]|nr:WbqC family protein [Bacteroidales bacterium]
MALFSTAYFPPLSYMKELIHASKASIEQHETYPKQTYRNRCYIYTANGRLPLIVPVIKTNGNRTKTKDIKIAYDEKWQQNHIRALESAYSASAYYLFYKDEIETIISGGYEYLTDLNNAILTKLLDLIHIKKQLSYTKNFQKESNQETDL